MEKDFKQWLALFRTSIANYQYYTISVRRNFTTALTAARPLPPEHL